ncbi:MAG: F0F1 ATP synthase subunit gamma [Rhodocyclaceae bacterium]|nr:F0F1 ATP synthase subunit gamma [Rhodocyclaceae bacterium]
MSGLAEISQRVVRLKEIKGIMTAMKSLSLVETRKLARFIDHQRRMLANIEAAAADFAHFFPAAAGAGTPRVIILLIGSERGFCGNFNERVLAALQALPPGPHPAELVVVGQRLAAKLAPGAIEHANIIARLDGPSVTEDVPAVLGGMMDALHKASRLAAGDVALFGLAHDGAGEPRLKQLLPLPATPAAPFATAPQLQLAPSEFFAQLLDQYLLSALYGLIYESLAVENHQRLAHMEYAIDRLAETLDALALKRNALRQEKIVEEIEVMLSCEQASADGA